MIGVTLRPVKVPKLDSDYFEDQLEPNAKPQVSAQRENLILTDLPHTLFLYRKGGCE